MTIEEYLAAGKTIVRFAPFMALSSAEYLWLRANAVEVLAFSIEPVRNVLVFDRAEDATAFKIKFGISG